MRVAPSRGSPGRDVTVTRTTLGPDLGHRKAAEPRQRRIVAGSTTLASVNNTASEDDEEEPGREPEPLDQMLKAWGLNTDREEHGKQRASGDKGTSQHGQNQDLQGGEHLKAARARIGHLGDDVLGRLILGRGTTIARLTLADYWHCTAVISAR